MIVLLEHRVLFLLGKSLCALTSSVKKLERVLRASKYRESSLNKEMTYMSEMNKSGEKNLVNNAIDNVGNQRYDSSSIKEDEKWHDFLEVVSLMLMNYQHVKEGKCIE